MKSGSPLVSIIMNSHNGEKFLNRSVKSILGQTYKNWELIFWDNNSTDKSKEKIKKFKDKRIKYYSSKKFYTLYKSRNLAIKKAKGKYLSFLDVDDYWTRNRIIEQVKKIEDKNEFFIYSNYTINNMMIKKKRLRKNYLPEGYISQNLLDDYFLGIITTMIKRSIFKKYRFNEKYNIIGDFDLFIRLSFKYKFLAIQKSLSTYNIHGNNLHLQKIQLYINELQHWIKDNEKVIPKKFNLTKLKIYLFRLKIKKALKKIFTLKAGM